MSRLVLLLLVFLAAYALAKSNRRGIAYDVKTAADLVALSGGVTWWYNWSPYPNKNIPGNYSSWLNMEFIPMLWNDQFSADDVVHFIQTSGIKYFLVLNEPNLVEQANMNPQQAAAAWWKFEDVANRSGAALVGPQMSWGTMNGYSDPLDWMDSFLEAYRSQNGGRDPRIDYLGFHWYDYGLSAQLDRLAKYNKKLWISEMANWHNGDGDAAIDTFDKQAAQLKDMVGVCEGRPDVFRYAWFTGRIEPDDHFSALLCCNGKLLDLGVIYTQQGCGNFLCAD